MLGFAFCQALMILLATRHSINLKTLFLLDLHVKKFLFICIRICITIMDCAFHSVTLIKLLTIQIIGEMPRVFIELNIIVTIPATHYTIIR